MHGLTGDYTSLHKDGKDDADLFQLHLQQTLINAIGEAATCGLTIQRHTVEGNDLYRVHVPPSPFPVDAKVTLVNKTGQHQKKVQFYVRIGNGTRAITDPKELDKYVLQRWGTPPASAPEGSATPESA